MFVKNLSMSLSPTLERDEKVALYKNDDS